VRFTNLVAAAVARGRNVRAYVFAADPRATLREEMYLRDKGYMRAPV